MLDGSFVHSLVKITDCCNHGSPSLSYSGRVGLGSETELSSPGTSTGGTGDIHAVNHCTGLSCDVSLCQGKQIYWQSHCFLPVQLVKMTTYSAIKIFSAADLTW